MANGFTPFQKKKGRKKRIKEEAVKKERRIMKMKNKKERKRRRRTKSFSCLTTQFKKKVDWKRLTGGGYSKGTARVIIQYSIIQHGTAL